MDLLAAELTRNLMEILFVLNSKNFSISELTKLPGNSEAYY